MNRLRATGQRNKAYSTPGAARHRERRSEQRNRILATARDILCSVGPIGVSEVIRWRTKESKLNVVHRQQAHCRRHTAELKMY